MADDPQTEPVSGGAAAPAEPQRARRTAVLIVHGIGNQRPLDTLRGVVDAVWTTDRRVGGPKPDHWLHFDRAVGDIDLPVVTTSTVAGQRHQIEFHELYWAHVMAETRLVAVLLWLFEFVRKGPRPLRPDVARVWHVAVPFLVVAITAAVLLLLQAGLAFLGLAEIGAPWDLVLPWVLTAVLVRMAMGRRGLWVLATLAVFVLLAAMWFRGAGSFHEAILWRLSHAPGLFTAGGVMLILAGMAAFFLTSVVGDAARYYRNSPANISVRREIRAIGARTLAALHNGHFDRVVVVAHSLGSVIAYDILRAYWSEVCSSFRNVAGVTGLSAQDRFPLRNGVPVPDPVTFDDDQRTAWRNRGRALLSNLEAARATPEKPFWLVTDFVTLGSPLTHARYLNAAGGGEAEMARNFEARLDDREAPTCPPRYDGEDGRLTFTADGYDPATMQRLHHAALFGLTRWTNLHFPAGAFNGDMVGGELGTVLGTGIRDVEVPRPGRWALSWHTAYWNRADAEAPPPHIVALREAVNLLDEPEA